jgi:dihydrofolate reductase
MTLSLPCFFCVYGKLLLLSYVASFALLPSSQELLFYHIRNTRSNGVFRYPLSSRFMRTSGYIATTVDGFIADDNGSIDFLNAYQQQQEQSVVDHDDIDKEFQSFLSTIDIIVMGRKTFETVQSFGWEMWPYGPIPVVVWTTNPNYNNSIPLNFKDAVNCSCLPIIQLYHQLKTNGYQHLYVDGGSTLQSFLRARLLDEIHIFRIPLLLGSGIPLFDTTTHGTKQTLTLSNVRSFSNGIIKTSYVIPR